MHTPEQLTDDQIVALRDEYLPNQGESFDCGEAGHSEGRCGNGTCLTQPAEPGELPPLPMHPEPRTYTWSALEARTIERYGTDCARLALATSPLPAERVERVMVAAVAAMLIAAGNGSFAQREAAIEAVRAILEGRV